MKKVFLLSIICVTSFAFSQIPNSTSPSFIEVIGTAKREISPNLIYVSITLTEKSIDKEKYTIESQEKILNQILTELNIAKSKLTLSDFDSSVITEKRKEVGIRQSKEFMLLLETVQQVSGLFKKLFEANIKEADVYKTDHTDMVNYNKEVRIEALKAAKSKAEYLLLAVGNKLGKPLEIIELNQNSNRLNFNTSNSNVSNAYTYSANSTNEFKSIIISFSYQVKYSIE